VAPIVALAAARGPRTAILAPPNLACCEETARRNLAESTNALPAGQGLVIK
jgi:hypothetical protein